jgi:hypothetical protein
LKIQDLQEKKRGDLQEIGGWFVVILVFNILGLVRVNPNWVDNLEKQESHRGSPYCLYIKMEGEKTMRNLKGLEYFLVEIRLMFGTKEGADGEKSGVRLA